MPRAVKFDKYGGVDVLHVVEVDQPVPGPRQVLIRMKAAGINPGEAMIREGAFAKQWPATFPSGQGSDLEGVVGEQSEAGSETSGWATSFIGSSRTIGPLTPNWLLSRLTM